MTKQEPVYLDYAASTPLHPAVLEVMLPLFSRHFGNPSSVHGFGQQAEAAVENARETMAGILGCQSGEIIFTSCGTESDNLALRGAALQARRERQANRILVTPVEHHAVTHTARQLAGIYGFEVEMLPVDPYGQVDPGTLMEIIRADTAVVSVIFANNEIGTINPIREIAAICREKQVAFHSDAVQAAAHIPLNMDQLGVDLLSIGAHKFYGPKGVGALYCRKGINLIPYQTGGGQEGGRRAGTLNVPLIAGMAEALRITADGQAERSARLAGMRDDLIRKVLTAVPDAQLSGHPTQRLPNHASFVFNGADGNYLLTLLDSHGYACSSGSACKTGNPEPSDVLLALGLSREWALGSLRVTLGESTTCEIIDKFSALLTQLVEQARR